MNRYELLAFVFIFASPAFAENPHPESVSRALLEELENSQGISDADGALPVNKLTLNLIKDYEGFEGGRAYDDPIGLCTIGYGHLIKAIPKPTLCAKINLDTVENGKFLNRPLSEEEAFKLLDDDTLGTRVGVKKLLKPELELNRNQFGALVSFAFNVGVANFGKSTLLKLVNKGEHDLAARQFAKWVLADGKPFRGLKKRRACEEALYRGKLKELPDYTAEGVCGTLGIAEDGKEIDIYVGE